MAHIRVLHKATGKHLDVWSVDAAELIASGEYSMAPATGVMEGVPGETVMRPFDPTMHREDPASHPGDMVTTTPEGVAAQPVGQTPRQAAPVPNRQAARQGQQAPKEDDAVSTTVEHVVHNEPRHRP